MSCTKQICLFRIVLMNLLKARMGVWDLCLWEVKFRFLSLYIKLKEADEILPAFIYCVIKSMPLRLQTDLHLMDGFADNTLRSGEVGYLLTMCKW